MNTLFGILIGFVGLGMIGFWTMHALKGGLPQGFKTIENGGFIGFHVTAELLTGIACMVGGIGLIAGAGWSGIFSLVACGALFYTSLNSLAWSEVRTKQVMALMFVFPLIIATAGIIWLLAR